MSACCQTARVPVSPHLLESLFLLILAAPVFTGDAEEEGRRSRAHPRERTSKSAAERTAGLLCCVLRVSLRFPFVVTPIEGERSAARSEDPSHRRLLDHGLASPDKSAISFPSDEALLANEKAWASEPKWKARWAL